MERRRHHSKPRHHRKYSRDAESNTGNYWAEVKRSNSNLGHHTACSSECCPIQERLEDGRKPDCHCNNQRAQRKLSMQNERRYEGKHEGKYENNMKSDSNCPPSPCGVTACPNANASQESICLGPVAASDHLESIQHVDREANDYAQTEIDDVDYYPLAPLPNCRCSRNPRARRFIPNAHNKKHARTQESYNDDTEPEYNDRVSLSNRRRSCDSPNYKSGENEYHKSRRHEPPSRSRRDRGLEAGGYKREGFDSRRRRSSREQRRGYDTSSNRRQGYESPNYGDDTERPRYRHNDYEDAPSNRRHGYESSRYRDGSESTRHKRNDYEQTDPAEYEEYSPACYCEKGKFMCFPSPDSTVPCHCKKGRQKSKPNPCLRPASNNTSSASLRSNGLCRNTSCQTKSDHSNKSPQPPIIPRGADGMEPDRCSIVLESPPPIECPPSKVLVPQTILECPTPIVECPPQRVVIPPPIVEYSEPILECPPQIIECPQPSAGECPSPLQECRSSDYEMSTQRVMPTVVQMPPQRVVIPPSIIKCPATPERKVCRQPACPAKPSAAKPCPAIPCPRPNSNCSCAGKAPGSDRCCTCGCCRQ